MRILWHGVLATLVLTMVVASATAAVPLPARAGSTLPRAQSTPPGGRGGGSGTIDMSSGSVAVIPFTNISRNEADDWIGDGIAETVTADLASQGNLTVIAQERVRTVAAGHGDAAMDDVRISALGRDRRIPTARQPASHHRADG